MKQKWLGRMAVPILAACTVLANCSGRTSTTQGVPTAFAALRLAANGTPDTSFAGGKGIALTHVDPAQFEFALAIVVQSDNKIVAGGSSGLAGQGVIGLVRYNADGSLDTGFGISGTVRTTTPAGWTASSATALAVQPDGKILAAALLFNGTNTGIQVLRYNANGSLDTTGFGAPNGYVIGTIGKGNATDTCALALQGTNVVVAGGSSDGNVVLYRYDTTGTLDATFGTGGKTATAIGLIARPPAIALQSTGKIVVATGNDVDQVVLRYSADGILDATFGNAATPGKVVTDIGGATNFGNAIAAQSNDKIVVLGHANVDIAHDTSDITLVRFGADGALDTNFNSTGIVTTDLAGRFDNGLAVVLQEQPPADAAVVVAGNTGRAGFTQIVVLRYKNDGSLDTSFGPTQEGVVLVNVVGPGTVASANAVALQAVGTGVGIVTAGFD